MRREASGVGGAGRAVLLRRAGPSSSSSSPERAMAMALKAEGAAPLDCFEVTLKCEDDLDEDDEAVVVAVIPRPGPARSGG